MTQMAPAGVSEIVESTLDDLASGVLAALPSLIAAAGFTILAYLGIKLASRFARRFLERVYPRDEQLVVDLYVAVLSAFLWFGALLALFEILGLGDVAASLGTSTGFVALGVAYALSDMIEDTVSGVYLLRDPDFEEGDVVAVGNDEGEVLTIGLRKSRLATDEGDTLVVRNRDVDAGWTKRDAG